MGDGFAKTLRGEPISKLKAVEVETADGPLKLVERGVPEPGICHSDSLTKKRQWPGLDFYRVPGHEIAGVIA